MGCCIISCTIISVVHHCPLEKALEIVSINKVQLLKQSSCHEYSVAAATDRFPRRLFREGYDKEIANRTALNLFGTDIISFLAIDGTESQDQQLDIHSTFCLKYASEIDTFSCHPITKK
jgi:hypothetical protein